MSRVNSTSSFNKNQSNSNTQKNPTKDLSIWEWEDVSEWLKIQKMNQYVELFQKYEANGYDLCYLTNEDLNEMRINNFHDRNLILKNIRLMIIEQCKNIFFNLVKIQVIYNEKIFTIQLDFDPNFTTEMLMTSLLDLFKIQGALLYMLTQDDEILMPNIKIIDLILLNPKKYKTLKVISTIDEYSWKPLNHNENKYYNEPKEMYTFNKKSTNDIQLYNENSNNNAFKTFDKDKEIQKEEERAEQVEDYNHYYNYNNPNKDLINKDKDDLLLSSTNPLVDYNYSTKNEHSNYNNLGSANYNYKSEDIEYKYNIKDSLKSYEHTMSNLIGGKYKETTPKYLPRETLEDTTVRKPKVSPINQNYERISIREKGNYNEDRALNMNSQEDFNYENNYEKNYDKSFERNYDKPFEKTLENTNERNFNRNFDKNAFTNYKNFSDQKFVEDTKKDQDEAKNTHATTPTNLAVENHNTGKYNYTERFKEDFNNRQRFASEKRSFRTYNDIKNEEKLEELGKNNNNNYDKFSFRSTNLTSADNKINKSELDKETKDHKEMKEFKDLKEFKEKDTIASNKDEKERMSIPSNSDINKNLNTVRSLNGFGNNPTISNLIANAKSDGVYKFSSIKDIKENVFKVY